MIDFSPVCQSVYLCIHLSVCLSVCLSAYPCVLLWCCRYYFECCSVLDCYCFCCCCVCVSCMYVTLCCDRHRFLYSVMGNRNPFLNPRGASARASCSNHNKIRRVALSYVSREKIQTSREPPPGYVAKLATTIHYYVYYRLVCVTRVMVYILLPI